MLYYYQYLYESLHFILLLKGGCFSETYGSIGRMPEYKLNIIHEIASHNEMPVLKSTFTINFFK